MRQHSPTWTYLRGGGVPSSGPRDTRPVSSETPGHLCPTKPFLRLRKNRLVLVPISRLAYHTSRHLSPRHFFSVETRHSKLRKISKNRFLFDVGHTFKREAGRDERSPSREWVKRGSGTSGMWPTGTLSRSDRCRVPSSLTFPRLGVVIRL